MSDSSGVIWLTRSIIFLFVTIAVHEIISIRIQQHNSKTSILFLSVFLTVHASQLYSVTGNTSHFTSWFWFKYRLPLYASRYTFPSAARIHDSAHRTLAPVPHLGTVGERQSSRGHRPVRWRRGLRQHDDGRRQRPHREDEEHEERAKLLAELCHRPDQTGAVSTAHAHAHAHAHAYAHARTRARARTHVRTGVGIMKRHKTANLA